MWKPNVTRRNMMINGEKQRLNVCTRCLRTMVKVSLNPFPASLLRYSGHSPGPRRFPDQGRIRRPTNA